MKDKKELKVDTPVTNQGIMVYGGEIEQSDYDNELTYSELMKDITDMRNSDCIASSSLDILIYPIYSANITCVLSDEESATPIQKECVDYVNWVLSEMLPTKKYHYYHALLAYPYGFAMFEKVYARGVDYKGKTTNCLIKLNPIQYDTIFQWHFTDSGEFAGIRHIKRTPEKGDKYIDIEAKDLILFTPFTEFGNPQGRSMLRPARERWMNKKSIWKSSARAVARGAGIPVFTITPTNNDSKDASLFSKAKTMGKTVGNSDQSYVIEEDGVLKFRLEALQNVAEAKELIELCNREMLYNTLSQFITSGIGESGSRAATSEHKSPYLETLQVIQETLEEVFYKPLVEEIIDASYLYGKLTYQEYPRIVIERMKEDSLDQVAKNLLTLAQSGIVAFNEVDEEYIRKMFTLPAMAEKVEDETISTPDEEPKDKPNEQSNEKLEMPEETDTPDETKQPEETQKGNLSRVEVNKEKMNWHELNIFEYANASKTINILDERARNIVEDIYDRIINDAAKQLAERPTKRVELRFKKELFDRLNSVFNEGIKRGRDDIRKEWEKVGKTNLTSLAVTVQGTNKLLSIKIDTFYDIISNALREAMGFSTQAQIDNAGGIEEFIVSRFQDSEVGIRNSIAGYSASGYTAGRNQAINELAKELMSKDNQELILKYTNALENPENICEVCFPLGGRELTLSECRELGLNVDGSPVNPECKGMLGGRVCRCQLIPIGGKL